MKCNLFARWFDPQFDEEDEELPQEVEQEETSGPRTEESPQERHNEQVEVIHMVEDPIKVVVEQV